MTLDAGLLFASDSRTNAGVDHISTFCKMSVFEAPGERAIVLLNSGNLATTQTVISTLRKAIGSERPNLMTSGGLFDCAALVGEATRSVIAHHAGQQAQAGSVDFSCSFLVGGQIAGERPRLFLVYPEGNFIEATDDTPYFQIGESKYGKPIIDRVIKPSTPVDEALKCALVSFEVRPNAMRVTFRHRVDVGDAYFGSLRQGWSQGLRRVFNELPSPDWLQLD